MPSLQTIDTSRNNPDPTGVEAFFSKLGKDYKDRNDQVEIGNLISQYQTNRSDANALEDLFLNIEKAPISPSKKVEAITRINEGRKTVVERDKALTAQTQLLEKQNAKNLADKAKADKEKQIADEKTAKAAQTKAEVKEILINSGEDPEEAERLSSILTPATATARVKPVSSKKGTKEIFEEGLAKEASKEVPKLEAQLSKSQDVLDNIDTIQKLAEDNLSGIPGYAKALFNTESAAQLSTLSASNLDTIVKIFNPVGALPVAKLNWIRNTFSVSPYDNQSTIVGKLNTQRLLAEQAKRRTQERVGLLKKYHGVIPEDVTEKFDQDTNRILDQIERPGYIQVRSPEGKLKWVPTDVANQLEGQ